ncbi:hypothetical protein [Mycobacterium sp. 236(2023)]|uniref:hypothetical protein n=1 Tax=Mycobacterium sp. 236(2023) TaxID=3038163 RepID=UPI0024156F7D|nr:hypothetical protein [Mycobacterium sp. 236(2023)]MDG4669466.1 hypothetical protein [Mycobacterium sp. 236(2023)]
MAFTIQLESGNLQKFGDDEGFEIRNSGVLMVAAKDETIYFTPGRWSRVNADVDHYPNLLAKGQIEQR